MKFRFLNTNEPVTTYYRDLVPYFTERGHEVELLVSKAIYRDDRKFDEFFDGMENVKIKKTFAGPFKSYNSFLSKGFVHLFYAIHGFLYMLFGPKADVNIFLTQPPFFYLFGPLLSKWKGTPFYVVVMDLQPDEYVEFGVMKRDSWYTKWLGKKTVAAFQKAEGIIVIGRCMADVIAEKGIPREKIHFIPNWTTETVVKPVPAEENLLRRDRGWDNKFVISYGGNVGNAQLFDDFLDVAEELEEYDDLVMVLIGGGMRFKGLQEKKEQRKIKNLEMMPFLHNKYPLAMIYGAGDLNFISLRENCTGHGVPSKAYVSLAVGRPILFQGSPKCEIYRMVEEEEIGRSVRNKEELKAAVIHFYNNRQLSKDYAVKARHLSDTKYSTAQCCSAYLDLLSKAGKKVLVNS